MASHRRGPWSQGEDAYLTQLVHTQGPLNWVRIAQLIGSRSPKQCRERYHQNLKPSLNHEPISAEEGLIIERLVGEIGKRWAEIARRLHGRSDNAVKNWWNGSMNRRRRSVVRRRTSTSRGHMDYDESRESHPYSRQPVHHRPLTITSQHSLSYRQIDPALPSPTASDVSRSDSTDVPPSLISDSGSRHSTSPRGLPSPAIELPPLTTIHNSRRQSVSMLHFGSGNFVSEADNRGHAFSATFSQDSKPHRHTAANTSPFYNRQEQVPPPYASRPNPWELQQSNGPSTQPTPVRLPPINMPSPSRVDRPVERPSDRMNIASLLR